MSLSSLVLHHVLGLKKSVSYSSTQDRHPAVLVFVYLLCFHSWKTTSCFRRPLWILSHLISRRMILLSLLNASVSQVVTDLCACWDRVVLRRRTAKDTSERWYHGGNPRSETALRLGVRFWDVVEEGRVEYVPVGVPSFWPPGPSKIRSSPSKRKRKISRYPVKLPRRFEVSSPPAIRHRRSLI